MRKINTDILVIGGGATGTGILRDLAMRGFKCVLLEKRDLATGTTGRYHGLLHSGGRYAVKDPSAAKECIAENHILRRIMPQCIEDTGGFFVLTEIDDPLYIPQFINGCKNANIPVDEISIKQMLKEEPLLNPRIKRCFRVPDASADSFLAADLNVKSASEYGAIALTYHEVEQIITEPRQSPDDTRINSVICHDLVKGENVQIFTDMVINASGAWAGKIASLVGIHLNMLPGKGTMVAVNHRIVNTVINRCKLPADGDILVPAHTVAVMGTTDIRVSDPDHYSIEPWEIRLMLDEGEKIIPGFKQFRLLRAWAGVRPLIQEEGDSLNRDISRSYTLIDHGEKHRLTGFITITGGKWTTYRKMAEVTVDLVCEKLSTKRQCRTHLEELPSLKETSQKKFFVGEHLERVEKTKDYGQLVCECELATFEDVKSAIISSEATSLDDIRRDVRLGMGPCQAAFCAFRATGILHAIRNQPINETNSALINFLQERWKGNIPILWGQQLRQQRFNELIYANNLNIIDLPIKEIPALTADSYLLPAAKEIPRPPIIESPMISTGIKPITISSDIVIVGAGLSGLITGWLLSTSGKKVQVISKGWGSTYWTSGCIDFLGFLPPDYPERVDNPLKAITDLVDSKPDHPYALAGTSLLEEAVNKFIDLTDRYSYPYQGSINQNFLLPTAVGSVRPTCLAPLSMVAGDVRLKTPMLIIGFDQFLDFYPGYITDNLVQQGILARGVSVDIKTLDKLKFLSASVLARLFDKPSFREEVIAAIRPLLGTAGRIGFPAVLGLNNTNDVIHNLEDSFGLPVFEIPGLPPSVPGIRLNNLMVSAIENNGGTVNTGMNVNSFTSENTRITSVLSDASNRKVLHTGENYILASGGILGGGITVDENGYAKDTVFNLPINLPPHRIDRFRDRFLAREGQPIYLQGLSVNALLHPLEKNNLVAYENLFAVGTILDNCDPIREASIQGIALATGLAVAKNLGV